MTIANQKKPGFIRRLFSGLGRLFNGLRLLTVNLVFLFVVVFIISLASNEIPQIPDKGALIVNPQGTLVDQLSYIDPLVHLLGENNNESQETLLQDVIDAITLATTDERITSIVLDLDSLARGGISKMQEIAQSLEGFRETGKKIYAIGDYYSQDQYWLAAQADEIYVHPMGGVSIEGYGLYRNYFKQALEKLEVSYHVFRVGAFKSGPEHLIRDDMSEQARQSNQFWLDQLWGEYVATVAERRSLKPLEINQYVNEMDVLLAQYHGNTATAAMAAGLIDGVKTRDEANTYLVEKVGAVDEDGFFQGVDFDSYVWLRGFEDTQPETDAVVGIIVAKGVILNGRQPAGGIGGDSLAELIHQARTDIDINAVVLRVDSGGGSPFASEIIRRELLLLQQSGKPLVVSMGSMAASGGYWISSLADEIWATPTTLTGSIGIYGAFPTLDKSLAKLGVHTDGVGTTELAGAMRLDRPLNPIAERIIQSSVEQGYEQFIDIVADGRGMDKASVEKVAAGRVWSGADAYGNGLVDKLGGLEEAIAAAAQLAELGEYRRQWIELELSPQEQFLRELGGVLSPLGKTGMPSQWQRFVAPFRESIELLSQMNDPRGVYVQCVSCIAP